MVDDEEVIEEIAGRFTGSSDVVQIRNTKDGIKKRRERDACGRR